MEGNGGLVDKNLQQDSRSEISTHTRSVQEAMAKLGRDDKSVLACEIQEESYAGDVNAKDWNPLHWAAQRGCKDMVGSLLSRGANVDSRDDSGWTPLHYAASTGKMDVVKVLLANKADINAKSKQGGWTPLTRAAVNCRKDVAELLLTKGVDVNQRNSSGGTPLSDAAFWGCTNVGEVLLANKADINAKDNYGQTPLHRAVFNAHKNMAELLLAKGADINAKDNIGLTPSQLAAQLAAASAEHKDILELLRRHGGPKSEATARPSQTYTIKFGDLPGGLEIQYEVKNSTKIVGTIKNTSPVPIGCKSLFRKLYEYAEWDYIEKEGSRDDSKINLDSGASQDFSWNWPRPYTGRNNNVDINKIESSFNPDCYTGLDHKYKNQSDSKQFEWGTITGSALHDRITLSFENNSDQPIEIDWNGSSFIDVDRLAIKMIPSRVSVRSIGSPFPKSVVRPHSKINESVTPMKSLSSCAEACFVNSLIPSQVSPELAEKTAKNYSGKKMSVYFQLIIDGKKTPATLDFEVQSMSIIPPPFSPKGTLF